MKRMLRDLINLYLTQFLIFFSCKNWLRYNNYKKTQKIYICEKKSLYYLVKRKKIWKKMSEKVYIILYRGSKYEVKIKTKNRF